jgi:hypothetical protein
MDIYETYFGIFDHLSVTFEKNKRPLASVALHDSENICSESDTYRAIDRYFEEDVYKLTGMSLFDFLALPREFVLLVYSNITKMKQRNIATEQTILNNLSNPKK